MAIYVTGDTHGNRHRLAFLDQSIGWQNGDFLLVCGDFGFVFEDSQPEHDFLDELEAKPYTLCFLDGNHENFPALFRYPEEEWCGGKIHRIRKNVIHLMRGKVYSICEKKLFTMGGAYSRDCYRRSLNVSYWQEELPTPSEYHTAIRNLVAHTNQVDFVLTHTCPTEIIRKMGCAPDARDLELTGFFEYLMYELCYDHWFFGHWHKDEEVTPKFTALFSRVIKL